MGITMGCMANSMHVMPIGSDGTSSGPSQWTMTGDDGRRLSLTQLKESIKVPLTEREVFVITKSWKTISRNMTHIGIAMFLRFADRGIGHVVMALAETQVRAITSHPGGLSIKSKGKGIIGVNLGKILGGGALQNESEGLGDTVPQWGPEAKPRQGIWGKLKLKHFCKYKPSNLRPL